MKLPKITIKFLVKDNDEVYTEQLTTTLREKGNNGERIHKNMRRLIQLQYNATTSKRLYVRARI